MVEALFFWALAVYGALMVVWQTVRVIQRGHIAGQPHAVNIILVVQDAEPYIEGILRTLLAGTAYSVRRRTMFVFDVRSTDRTGEIVGRLEADYAGIRYFLVDDEDQIVRELRQACERTTAVSCVYDLRNYEVLQDVTRDVMSLLP